MQLLQIYARYLGLPALASHYQNLHSIRCSYHSYQSSLELSSEFVTKVSIVFREKVQ